MSHRALTILAFTVAVVLTVVGWQQVMIYKLPSLPKVAVWFPLLLLIPVQNEFLRVLLAVVQFPLLAAVFTASIRLWKATVVAPAVWLVYILLVAAAFATLKANSSWDHALR